MTLTRAVFHQVGKAFLCVQTCSQSCKRSLQRVLVVLLRLVVT